MMTRDYNAVLTAVSRATGIPEPQIFSKCRGQNYYDARWIAVQMLNEMGYYSSSIAEMTGMTRRNVNKILTNIHNRSGCTWQMFSRRLECVRKAMGTHIMA